MISSPENRETKKGYLTPNSYVKHFEDNTSQSLRNAINLIFILMASS